MTVIANNNLLRDNLLLRGNLVGQPNELLRPVSSIMFINSAFTQNTVPGFNAQLTLPYVSRPGDTLLLMTANANTGLSGPGEVVSVVDSNGGTWTNLGVAAAKSVDYMEVWGIANSPAITSVTVTFTGSNNAGDEFFFLAVSEWEGAASIGTQNVYMIPNAENIGGDVNTPNKVTETLNSPDNWLVASFLSAGPNAVPIGILGNLRQSVGYVSGNGHVNTNGTQVTWVSGTNFQPSGNMVPWSGPIVIHGVTYTISSVNSATSITLTTTAGIQTNVTYTFNNWGPGNSIAIMDNTAPSATSVTVQANLHANSGWGAVVVELIAKGNPIPPTVSGSAPSNGTSSTPVTITGSGFVSGATVAFFDELTGISHPATSVVFVNSGEITCVSPVVTDGSGDFGDIIVTNPNGTFGGFGNNLWTFD